MYHRLFTFDFAVSDCLVRAHSSPASAPLVIRPAFGQQRVVIYMGGAREFGWRCLTRDPERATDRRA